MHLIPVLIAVAVSSSCVYFFIEDGAKRWPGSAKRLWIPAISLFCLIIAARIAVTKFIPREMQAVDFGTALGGILTTIALALSGAFNSKPGV